MGQKTRLWLGVGPLQRFFRRRCRQKRAFSRRVRGPDRQNAARPVGHSPDRRLRLSRWPLGRRASLERMGVHALFQSRIPNRNLCPIVRWPPTRRRCAPKLHHRRHAAHRIRRSRWQPRVQPLRGHSLVRACPQGTPLSRLTVASCPDVSLRPSGPI